MPDGDSQAGDLGAGLADSIMSSQAESNAPAPDAAPPQGQTQQVEQTEDTSGVGDNPAWGSIREKLGDPLYHSIKPLLADFDKNAHTRITQLNEQVKRYQPFESILTDQVTPEFLQGAIQLASWADQSPESLYENLGNFLRENGRMPETPAELEEALGDEDEDTQEQGDPEVAELREQVERFQDAFRQAAEQQQLQQYEEQTVSQLTQEMQALQAAHPYLDGPALRMVIEQAKAIHMSTGEMPKLADVAAPLLQYRESILKTPRPSDSAPRLPGSGGGMPSASKPVTQLTRDDRINSLADMVTSARSKR